MIKNLHRSRTESGNISELILLLLLAVAVIFAVLQWILIGSQVGLPNDEVYKIGITSEDSLRRSVTGEVSFVYGSDATEVIDKDSGKVSNSVVIVDNIYEARFLHYAKTANKKSFFGYHIVSIERVHVKDEYFIPASN